MFHSVTRQKYLYLRQLSHKCLRCAPVTLNYTWCLWEPNSIAGRRLTNNQANKTTEIQPPISLQNCKKKDVSGSFPSSYDPRRVEEGWFDWWESEGFMKPEYIFSSQDKTDDTRQEVFSMVIPPPNITGPLHLGHSLTVAVQDALVRWNRMKRKKVIWIPGCDHAGIATQVMVEKKLMKERKITRQQLGKEGFLKEILKWKVEKAQNINEQLRRLGASLDFGRLIFTLDDNINEAVIQSFLQLFDEGLIYRQEKLINWSCHIQSAISDIEVDHIEIPGNCNIRVPGMEDPVEVGIIEMFAYPVIDSDESVVVATSRLETMLGDKAIAVNPHDSRYNHLVGKYVKHPFNGEKLIIVADEFVDKNFGTGAMKVTPAHNQADFELAMRHDLSFEDILDDAGNIKHNSHGFGGLPRFTARKRIREVLEQEGLYRGKSGHPTSLPLCSRTGDIIEPRLKPQWYLNCSKMATKAIQAVEDGSLKLIPSYYENVWMEWLKKRQDWCISRQLWWGHHIPAYLVIHPSLQGQDKELWVAARNEKEAIEKAAKELGVNAQSVTVKQDEDVLDTWFSSSLLPSAAFGWPIESDELKEYYPLSLMETGHDILFFWVARMVMLGQQITGKLPFNKVLLHGMLCDSEGRKMTKSLGNVVDPLDIVHGLPLEDLERRIKDNYNHKLISLEELNLVLAEQKQSYPSGIPECGTDGLRFALLSHCIKNQIIKIDVKHIRACRHFCNKIWQGTKYFFISLEKCQEDPEPLFPDKHCSDLTDVDWWILSRLSNLVTVCNAAFEAYDFHLATEAIHNFWVQDYCDVYLESTKPVVRFEDEYDIARVCSVMTTCINTFLRIISPIMPYLSEEIYQRLSSRLNWSCKSICIAPYPQSKEFSNWRNTLLEADMKTVLDLVTISRSLKSQHGATRTRPNVVVAVEDQATLSIIEKFGRLIETLAHLDSVTFHMTKDHEFLEHSDTDNWVSRTNAHGLTVMMKVEESAVIEKESSFTKGKLGKLQDELNKLSKMMADTGYRKKAPRSVRESNMAKKASLETEIQKILGRDRQSDKSRETAAD